MIADTLRVRWLGRQDYLSCWQAMRRFTDERTAETMDEIWLLEHDPVFTQGQNGQPEHLLDPGEIPVVQTDRGGQITYHGPGQLMAYTLIDLKRKKINIRELVTFLEQAIIALLAEHNINASAKKDAPGVYVAGEKICSIGLRVRRGCAYHGIAFNVAMDLAPFKRINPCGFSQLTMTQFSTLGGLQDTLEAGRKFVTYLMQRLAYNEELYDGNQTHQ